MDRRRVGNAIDGLKEQNMIKVIILDMGGVFIRQRSTKERRRLDTQLGLPPGELGHRLYGGEEWRLARVGAISEDEFWQRVGPKIGLMSAEEIHAFQKSYLAQDKARLETRLVELMRQLREHYRIALLSNATNRLEHLLENELGIADLFDLVINSAHVGLAKPDPAIYELTWQQLDVAPHETLFVDDQTQNLISAARLGIHAIHHVSYERTAAQIQALLDAHALNVLVDVPIPEDYAGMLAISQAIAGEDWWGAVLMLAQPETTADIAVLCDDPENLVRVARINGQVAGMGLHLQPMPAVLHHTAELSVTVHPDYWRHGVARRLIRALLPAAARRGVELVRAWVASPNGAARVLVAGLGFQEMARLKEELQHPDGRRFDVIVYNKQIADDKL